MKDLYHIAHQLGNALKQKHAKVCTAESCTGGGIAYALTDIPGSSAWFEYGWITYSNAAKHTLLGVPYALLEEQGAVSEAVVTAMAKGALECSKADYGIAISGIAGPKGGTPEKPVGTVWVAWGSAIGVRAQCFHLQGSRGEIREQSILEALKGLLVII